MVCGIVFLALAVRSERLLRASGQELALGWQRAIVAVLWAQGLLLIAAVFTGVCGYMRLARLLGNAVLGSAYAALVLYAGVRVGEGLIAYALRALPLRDLLIVQRHRPLVQRRLTLALRWLSVGAWAYFTLDGLGVIGSISSAGTMVLGARYVRGSVSLSLGDVAAFALTVWAVFVVSSFVRFVLDEEVYPRVRLPRGRRTPSRRSCTTSSSSSGSCSRSPRSGSTSTGSRSWRARPASASASACGSSPESVRTPGFMRVLR
jgi:hypothetical protein